MGTITTYVVEGVKLSKDELQKLLRVKQERGEECEYAFDEEEGEMYLDSWSVVEDNNENVFIGDIQAKYSGSVGEFWESQRLNVHEDARSEALYYALRSLLEGILDPNGRHAHHLIFHVSY